MISPTESFSVTDITVCGVTYAISATFATQADLLSLLNDSLVPSFGLLGEFSIDGSNELIWTTADTCTGTNCINLEDPDARITVDGDDRETTSGDTRITL